MAMSVSASLAVAWAWAVARSGQDGSVSISRDKHAASAAASQLAALEEFLSGQTGASLAAKVRGRASYWLQWTLCISRAKYHLIARIGPRPARIGIDAATDFPNLPHLVLASIEIRNTIPA